MTDALGEVLGDRIADALVYTQYEEVRAAIIDAPDGVRRLAQQISRDAGVRSPAAAFIAALRRGEHKRLQLSLADAAAQSAALTQVDIAERRYRARVEQYGTARDAMADGPRQYPAIGSAEDAFAYAVSSTIAQRGSPLDSGELADELRERLGLAPEESAPASDPKIGLRWLALAEERLARPSDDPFCVELRAYCGPEAPRIPPDQCETVLAFLESVAAANPRPATRPDARGTLFESIDLGATLGSGSASGRGASTVPPRISESTPIRAGDDVEPDHDFTPPALVGSPT